MKVNFYLLHSSENFKCSSYDINEQLHNVNVDKI